MPHPSFGQERPQRLMDIAAEVLPARKCVGAAQRSGVLRKDAGRGKPSCEMYGDILRLQPYLSELADGGFVALDALGLGLHTSRNGRAIGVSGRPEPTLFVAGPLARGTFGELMGLPQVSNYALFIAEEARAELSGLQELEARLSMANG